MTTVYVARLETRHFDFEGVGLTEDEALATVEQAWYRHVASLPDEAQATVWFWNDVKDDVMVQPRTIGVPYRDGEEI